MWRKSLKSSAIYSTRCKIENLKMIVTLKTINSLLKLEKFNLEINSNRKNQLSEELSSRILNTKTDEYDSDDKNTNDEKNIPGTSKFNNNQQKTDNDDSTEIIELEWQQKVFSRYEIEYYKDAQNCVTDLEKEYHEWILRDNLAEKILQKNSKYNRIFTYVDSDNFIPEMNDDSFPQRKTEKETTLRAQKFSHPYTKSKVMYIYADLNPDKLIFMLRWLETEHMLIVYPDFNQFENNPYFIEIDTDYRHLYSYAVQNISTTVLSPSPGSAPPPAAAEFKLKSVTLSPNNKEEIQLQKQNQSSFKQLPTNARDLGELGNFEMQTNFLSLYDMPPKKYIRVNFLFNIQQAQDFEYNSLHVRYKIKLPKTSMKATARLDQQSGKLSTIPGITVECGNLNGSTHSSEFKWNKSSNGSSNERMIRKIKIWNFNYAFQLCLLIREKELRNQNATSLHIFFELISIDSWRRERSEGFCFLLIPIKPGVRHYNAKCYRPDYGFKDRIERFFIGGRRIFDFENFNNIENSEQFLNRFHTKCLSTGNLCFNSECIFQRNSSDFNLYADDEDEIVKKSSGMTLNDIMRSYQEARKRLEATTLLNATTDETNV